MSKGANELDQWVDGIRNRSDAAFTAVHVALADDLLSFANVMLRDRRAAEDAVQQAFIELVNAAPRLRGDGRSLRAWLYRSVRFTCLDEVRRRHRHPETPTDQVPETAVDEQAQEWTDTHLVAALDQLSERQRSLIVMRHVGGLSGAEIATATRSNRTAVYAAVRRAERRLRRLLEESSEPSVGTTATSATGGVS